MTGRSYFIRGPWGYVEKDYTKSDGMLPTLGGRPHPHPQHWYDIRWEALTRDCHKCVNCSSPVRLEVHHRTYQRWGRERLEDVYTHCAVCHELFHANRRLAA